MFSKTLILGLIVLFFIIRLKAVDVLFLSHFLVFGCLKFLVESITCVGFVWGKNRFFDHFQRFSTDFTFLPLPSRSIFVVIWIVWIFPPMEGGVCSHLFMLRMLEEIFDGSLRRSRKCSIFVWNACASDFCLFDFHDFYCVSAGDGIKNVAWVNFLNFFLLW